MSALAELAGRVQAVSDLYASRFDIRRDDDWHLLKLQEELGELVQAHLKLTGRGRVRGEDSLALEAQRAAEAADLFCSLLLYCRRFGIDLDTAIKAKWLAHLEPQP